MPFIETDVQKLAGGNPQYLSVDESPFKLKKKTLKRLL